MADPDTTPGGRLVLALDSSAALCAAAVTRGGVTLSAASEPMARGQAERLVPLAQEVAATAGIAPAQLSAVAVCTGPGNFTGVRIAVAAVRGLALALGVPAVGVERLPALAAEALAAGAPAALVAIPTRKGEIHAAVFGPGPDGAPRPLGPAATGAPDAVAAALAPGLPEGTVLRGAEGEALAAALGLSPGDPSESPAPDTIARLAGIALAAGGPIPRPAPVYLRPADAAPSSDRPPALLDG